MMTLKEFGTSDEKLCIFLTKEEANRINKLVFNNICCFLFQRKCFSARPYLLLNRKAYFSNLEINIMNADDLFIVSELIDKLIFITEIKEFVELFENKGKDNHEKDVFEYTVKDLTHNYIFEHVPMKITTILKIEPRCMLIINKDKKYVIYKINNEEYRVDCHDDDKFDWQIGFGLALSKAYGNLDKWKNAREYYRNSKTHKLDYKQYANWCIFEVYKNDMVKIKELSDKVKEINELGKVDL